jgi:hypothetical protein
LPVAQSLKHSTDSKSFIILGFPQIFDDQGEFVKGGLQVLDDLGGDHVGGGEIGGVLRVVVLEPEDVEAVRRVSRTWAYLKTIALVCVPGHWPT